MLKTSFLTVLITSVFSVLSQTAKVKLNMFVEDEKGKKMQSIIAVYKYNGQPFEDPINIGVETKKHQVNLMPNFLIWAASKTPLMPIFILGH